MDEEILKRIDIKITIIIRLIAEEKVSDLKLLEKIKYLSKLGLDKETIADISGVKKKTVGEIQSRLRRNRQI